MSNPVQASLGGKFRLENIPDVLFEGIIDAGDTPMLRARAHKVPVGDFFRELLENDSATLPAGFENLEDVKASIECAIAINGDRSADDDPAFNPDKSISFSIFEIFPSSKVTVFKTDYDFKKLSVTFSQTDGVLCKLELLVSINHSDFLFYFQYDSSGEGSWSMGARAESAAAGKLVIFNPVERDGFLKEILPPGGVTVDFDCDVGEFPASNIYSATPDKPEENPLPTIPTDAGVDIPVNATLFDALTIESIFLGADMPEGSEFKIPVFGNFS